MSNQVSISAIEKAQEELVSQYNMLSDDYRSDLTIEEQTTLHEKLDDLLEEIATLEAMWAEHPDRPIRRGRGLEL